MMGSPPPVRNKYYLTRRQWLQQILPGTISNFGPTPSRRDELHSSFNVSPWDVFDAIDNFIGESDDSSQDRVPIDVVVLDYNEASEATASFNFRYILRKVGLMLGCNLVIHPNASSRSSPRPNENASQQALRMASSPVQLADYGVSVNGKQFLVVEIEKPTVFRRTANSANPNLCSTLLEASRDSSLTQTVVSVEVVFQLFRYMKSMKLAYGIISSFDLTFLVRRGGDNGETVCISEGIPSTSPRFLGALAYVVDKAIKEPIFFKSPNMKHAQGGSSHAFALGSAQSQDSQGESKGPQGKERSHHHGLHPIKTLSSQPFVDDLRETPGELLHLAPLHFATGWNGRIVQGTYEGQRIVVKLAPTHSDRAEALLIEVMAYHKLKEFWGKYVPKLVSYGTTAGGMVVYIATEEIDGREIEMGTLSQEVVKEIFDAVTVVHGFGILHGDIRPSNILVAKGPQAGVHLIDFGFSRLITNSEDCKREHAQLERLLNEFNCSDVGDIRQSQLG